MSTFPGAGLLVGGLFLVFVAITIAGALMAALSTRLIRGVCGLALCCLGLAGLYYFLRSPFLALMEILIYVGAVCITIIFAVMLAESDEGPPDEPRGAELGWGLLGLLIGGGVFVALTRLATGPGWPAPVQAIPDGSVEALGRALLTRYSMAFELISLVLLVAILGALVIARSGRSRG